VPTAQIKRITPLHAFKWKTLQSKYGLVFDERLHIGRVHDLVRRQSFRKRRQPDGVPIRRGQALHHKVQGCCLGLHLGPQFLDQPLVTW